MSKVLQNAPMEHSAVLLTCIKVPNGFQAFVLSIFELMIKTSFTVLTLSYDVVSGSDIMPCIKIYKPLVVCRFSVNVITSIITLLKRWQNLDVFTPKMQFLINFHVL